MKNNKRSTVKKTTEQFIEEARQIHGDKYDYSKVEYINANTKVCIVCPLPQILTDYLSCEIAQIKEEEFKNEYKTYSYNILNRCKCGGLGIIPLEVKRNYTYKELFDIGKRYKTQREWARNEYETWYYAKQKGWVNEILVKKKNNPVIAMNIRTKETRIYESLSAVEKDGFTHSNVCNVCNNKRNFHKGWIFRYIVDGEIENVA